MTNEFTYRHTYCKSCRYNWETGTGRDEWGECDKCSNRNVASDDSTNIRCKCFESATTAKTCPYYVEDKNG